MRLTQTPPDRIEKDASETTAAPGPPGHLPRLLPGHPGRDGGQRRRCRPSGTSCTAAWPGCSGSWTRTRCPSPGCCWPAARWPSGSAAAGSSWPAWRYSPLASAACGLAPSLPVLVAARLVQGAGAALLVPSSLVLLQAAYPTREGRSRAFGIWGAIAGIGAASGPIVGGLLVTAWSWRGVFFLNLPFAVAALALAGRAVPGHAAPGPRPRPARPAAGRRRAGPADGALVEAGPAGLDLAAGAGRLRAGRAHAWAAFAWPPSGAAADPMLPLSLFGRPAFRSGSRGRAADQPRPLRPAVRAEPVLPGPARLLRAGAPGWPCCPRPRC